MEKKDKHEQQLLEILCVPDLDITGMSDDEVGEALEQASSGWEEPHCDADNLMEKILEEIGESRTARLYRLMPKWFQ